jgi:HlyD family secretion protein
MKKRIWIPSVLLAFTVAATWLSRRAEGGDAPAYRLATVERGNIEATVSATGTLSAGTTVQVGTQASGQISAISADFNDHVKKGQLIARIDPTLQQQAVRDAEASLERSRAALTKAEQDYTREKDLYGREMVSQSEYQDTEFAYNAAQADAKSAQIALDKARKNLAYTSIYAPIDGVIIERNVDVGQTVASSLQAPQLFLIANDLSRMQILAAVDESDIGQIHVGQQARFTVQAYPDVQFTGTVRQVRLQSQTVENVVNYTVVIDVLNPDGKLLPGMTATVAFIIGSATGVFTVPNAALRFRPGKNSGSAVWQADGKGTLTHIPVTTGITDGQQTEIAGQGLVAGMPVIVGTQGTQSAATRSSGSSSPFQSQSRSAGGPRGIL